jgi:hypothetical protein
MRAPIHRAENRAFRIELFKLRSNTKWSNVQLLYRRSEPAMTQEGSGEGRRSRFDYAHRPEPVEGQTGATGMAVTVSSNMLMKNALSACRPERSEGPRHLFSSKYWDASLRSA